MEDLETQKEEACDLLELRGRDEGELVLVDPFSIASAVVQKDGSTRVKVKNTNGYQFFVQDTPAEIQAKRRAALNIKLS
jgi:hypothetical protein